MSVNVHAVVEWAGSLEELISLFTQTWGPEDLPADCSSSGCIWIRHDKGNMFKLSDNECNYNDWLEEFTNVIMDDRCLGLWEVKK